MDKLIDGGNAVSLVGSSKTAESKKTSDTGGDSFSKILDQQTNKETKSAEKSREAIDKEHKDKSPQARNKEVNDLEEKLRQKTSNMTGMANYIYNIVLKNPDSMSMAEKQSFHVGEFAADGVGFKEFQKMLNQRGISLNDLTFAQIAQLTQRNSRGTINAFLDDLLKQMREGTLEKRPKASPLAASFQHETDDQKRRKMEEVKPLQPQVEAHTDASPMASNAAAQQAERADAARKEQRDNVIKQIIAHMDVKTVGDKTELTLKLNPEYLGDLKVKLSSQNGKLEAHFETTSAEVRGMLNEGWRGLKEMFDRKGLNLVNATTRLVETVE